ncbi:hypothetical protein OSTOST_20195 [Ostertagia ostertagi]
MTDGQANEFLVGRIFGTSGVARSELPTTHNYSWMSTVGFIGLGNMGAHMARNLMKNGHKLVVYDINKTVLSTFKVDGAERRTGYAPKDEVQRLICVQGHNHYATEQPSP